MVQRQWPVNPEQESLVSSPALSRSPDSGEAPGFFQTVGNGFMLENDVVAGFNYLTRETFRPDPSFRLEEVAPHSEYFGEYKSALARAESQEEFDAIESRIAEELRRRRELSQAGLTGILSGVAAGILSPTMLIPLTTPVRGAKGLMVVGANSALAAGIQEGLLATQDTRTTADSLTGFATATIVGSLLGGAAQYFRGSSEEFVTDMYNPQSARSVQVEAHGSVGAAVVDGVEGGFKNSLGADKLVSWLGPVTRTIQQSELPGARRIMQFLDDAGLKMEANTQGKATAVGGTVRNRITTYNGPLARSLQLMDQAWETHRLGSSGGVGRSARAALNQRFSGSAATVDDAINNGAKLSRQMFFSEVSRAMNNKDLHPIKEVQEVAQNLRKTIFDPIAQEAQVVGLLPEDLKVLGSESYLTRLYDKAAIAANPQKFLSTLSNHFKKKLEESFAKENAAAVKKVQESLERADDLEAPADKAAQYLAEHRKALQDLKDHHPGAVLQDELDYLSFMMRSEKDPVVKEQMKQQLKDHRAALKHNEEYQEFVNLSRTRKRRIKNLSQGRAALRNSQVKLLNRADRLEELNLSQLDKLVRQAETTLRKLDKMTDEALDEELSTLATRVEKTEDLIRRSEEKLTTLRADSIERWIDGDEVADATRKTVNDMFEAQQKRLDRLAAIRGRLEAAQSTDRAAARDAITLVRDDAVSATNRINSARAVRESALRQRAEKLDPAGALEEAKVLRQAPDTVFAELTDSKLGPTIARQEITKTDQGLEIDFTRMAAEAAESFRNKVMGTHVRTPGLDLITAERGPELARMLDISYDEISPFLETDIEAITKSYVRTMAPDIELMRIGDDPGLQSVVSSGGLIDRELTARIKANEEAGLVGPALERANAQAQRAADAAKRDINVVVQRLRHTRGIPDDPDSMFFRAGRTALDINVFSLMGNVVISSVADIARPVFKHGVIRTLKHGYLPMITNWKRVRMTQREALLSGSGVDLVLHSRFLAMLDVVDDVGRRSLMERGVQQLAQKTGIVAGFDAWNTVHKQLTASIVNAQLWESLDIVASRTASARKIADAEEFLASVGVDEGFAKTLMEQAMGDGGSDIVGGVRIPNTESWTDPDTVRTYRAVLAKGMDDTIVTPGPDRPNWVDKNVGNKLLAQFRSFTFTSTFKTLLAGMQERNVAAFNGAALSIGLGMLSYYLHAQVAGPKARERMENASFEDWVEEGIKRSGLLGVFAEPGMLAENMTTEWNTEQRVAGQLLGPSLGLALSVSEIGSAALTGEPTQQTTDAMRRFIPWQNVPYFRGMFDDAENALNNSLDLPKRR